MYEREGERLRMEQEAADMNAEVAEQSLAAEMEMANQSAIVERITKDI